MPPPQGPRAAVQAAIRRFHRRAWALACHTRMRAGFPRYATDERFPLVLGLEDLNVYSSSRREAS